MSSHGEVKLIDGKRVASPEYRSWQGMKNRCLNPNAQDYAYYGGRGIGVHQPWIDSFDTFLSDMGRRPEEGMSIERIDGDLDYAPNNCKWATRKEQARNRAYAKTKSWKLATQLGVKPMTAHHYIWQVRAKDKGNTKGVWIQGELEQIVRQFMKDQNICN